MTVGGVHGALSDLVWPALRVHTVSIEEALWEHKLPVVGQWILVILQLHSVIHGAAERIQTTAHHNLCIINIINELGHNHHDLCRKPLSMILATTHHDLCLKAILHDLGHNRHDICMKSLSMIHATTYHDLCRKTIINNQGHNPP